jgi:acetyltransferase-like isoleucine patch superfamily enzyme
MSLRSRCKAGIRRVLDPLLLRLHQSIEQLQADEAARFESTVPPGVRLGRGSKIFAGARLENLSGKGTTIRIGEQCQIYGEILTYWNAGQVEIGNDCFLGRQSRVWSQESVRIGNHVQIADLVDVHDSDGHPMDPSERRLDVDAIFAGTYRVPRSPVSSAVVIEDHVRIGLRAIVLKGVTIGAYSVVSPGAVVTKDVPPRTVVAGNPARVVADVEEIQVGAG